MTNESACPCLRRCYKESRQACHHPHRHRVPTCCERWKWCAQAAASRSATPPAELASAAACPSIADVKLVWADSGRPPPPPAVAAAVGVLVAEGSQRCAVLPSWSAAAANGPPVPVAGLPAKRDSCRALAAAAASAAAPALGVPAAEVGAEPAPAAASRLLNRASWPLPAPAAAVGLPGRLALRARLICCASLCAALPVGPRLFMRLSRPVMRAAGQARPTGRHGMPPFNSDPS